jgi:putative ABC transport system permease protein
VQELFGIPLGTLAVVLAVTCAAVLGGLAALALRNRIFFRLGVRNVGRRPARTALIVVGLMLGTAIISSALSTGDTISSTIRSTAVDALGQSDEIVTVEGAEVLQGQGFAGGGYFDEELFPEVAGLARDVPEVDGVAPAIIEAVAVLDTTSRQSEPRVTLFGSDPASLEGFGSIELSDGGTASLADLGAGEVYLTSEAADELAAVAGDELEVYAGDRSGSFAVKAIVEYEGAGRAVENGFAVLLGLDAAQELLGKQGEIKHILVSNDGDELSGAGRSDDVVDALEGPLAELGLGIEPVKQDTIELADEIGSAFTSFFTTFGTFSIAAGILLIFLIFVMLAAERRTEMGIARAVGTRRGHLVQMFVYEGVAYDLVAAAVGALLGIAIAYGMVLVFANVVGDEGGLEVRHDVQLRSIVVAYCLGVLLTLLVVGFSAWRVSLLNVVAAIRNLPAPPRRRSARFRLLVGLVGVGLGVAIAFAGASSKHATPFLLGISLAILGAVPLLLALRIPARLAYTAAGLMIVALWLLPTDTLTADYSMDFSIWLTGGIIVVVGATWVFMYNADLFLGALAAVAGRFRSLAPVVRMAAAYPLRNRFRTGTTLAMFTLVVFTLVIAATNTNAFTKAFNDVEAYGGGFDVQAATPEISAIDDMEAALRAAPGIDPNAFDVVASESANMLEARQAGEGRSFESYPVRGFDDAFLTHTSYGLGAVADGYGSAEEVWRAIAATPGLAVVDSLVVPRRGNWNFGPPPEFELTGFYLEDERFAPIPIEVRDPQTGEVLDLTVIGVLKDTAPLEMAGILTSQHTVSALGERARPTGHRFALAPGADAGETARALESAFLANGMEADAVSDILEDTVSANLTFNRIMQGFVGLGLVVGVAALGVISARSVVERRQQIGVLRSIGFQRRMIQGAFLLETSLVALGAIVVGTGLGLVVAYNVISESRETPSWENMAFAVPWGTLGVIFAIVYAVALGTAYVPARRASRVYPAEALRYE